MKSVWRGMISGLALALATGGLFAADGPPAPPKATEAGAPVLVSGPACGPVCCESCGGPCCGDLKITAGERTWFAWGESVWSVAVPGFLSDLKWHGIYSTVVELNLDATMDGCWVGRVDVGFGGVNDGHMDDFDFVGTDRTNLGSLSRNRISDDGLFYVNVDVGYRILSQGDECGCCGSKLTVDALVGYQYWREKYVASDSTQLVANPPFDNLVVGTFTPGQVDKEVWERNSLRVGLRGSYDSGCEWSLSSRLMFVPWAEHKMVDNHLLGAGRTYSNKGDGGFGVMWDGVVSYHINECLSAEAGYQIWYENVEHGTTQISSGGAAAGSGAVKELSTFRHGVLVGISYRF